MPDQHCLPILFSVLFGLTTVARLGQAIAYRKPFCWVLIMGSIWELTGLITRTMSTLDQTQTTFATISQPLVLLAPIWINAFVYMCLRRTMHYFLPAERVLGIKAETVAVIFICVTSPPSSFVVQAGGGLATDGTQDVNVVRIALLVYTSGVALQQLFICFFFAIAIRIIYRLAEYASGAIITDVTTHEVYYYVLDATPMFLALVVFCAVHPGLTLVGPGGEFEKKKGRRCCFCCCGRRQRRTRGMDKELPGTPASQEELNHIESTHSQAGEIV
ncbi:hypothetical protein CALCODRAFT_485204 [Calocera cornea HHB12733]|uniref:RTA1-domain-containing protein n=1 Tax=Calocera cornea HHB12733 TaxID=1353952 RepID=A0A165EHM5_9BASI|nr:hypothetical protein CALCODRAFT_485204 [Calocera cornea HHB12733]